MWKPGRKKKRIWKTFCHKNVDFTTWAAEAGFSFKGTLWYVMWHFGFSVEWMNEWMVLYGIFGQKLCIDSFFMWQSTVDWLFKFCPHMAPAPIRLNHIPDVPQRSWVVFSSLKILPVHTCVIGEMNSYSVLQLSAPFIMVAHHFYAVTHSDLSEIWGLELCVWPFFEQEKEKNWGTWWTFRSRAVNQ